MLDKYEKAIKYARQSSFMDDRRHISRALFILLFVFGPFLYWITSERSLADTTDTVEKVFHNDEPASIQWKKGQIRGALVILAREQDLYDIRGTMRDLEDRFNHKHGYPYIILSEQDLSQKFRDWIHSIVPSNVYFGHIDEQVWNEPSWIDTQLAEEKALEMHRHGVYHGESMSWRKMARFNSGFLAHHPLLTDAEYYWKVNPQSRYLCDVEEDPFYIMKANDKKLAFAISMYEDQRTMPTLWTTIQSYIYKNPDKVLNPDKSILPWISDNGRFNGCHFWNNFMIASLDFLRSDDYNDLFHYLDTSGGFFYERWGDAIFQTMAAALFLERRQVLYMENMGYAYSVATNCPVDKQAARRLNCICDPEQSFVYHQFSCTEALLQLQLQDSAQ